jgi:hypothetical protein
MQAPGEQLLPVRLLTVAGCASSPHALLIARLHVRDAPGNCIYFPCGRYLTESWAVWVS